MDILSKDDARYKLVLEFIKTNLETSSFPQIKENLVKKRWPVSWIDSAYLDLMSGKVEDKVDLIDNDNSDEHLSRPSLIKGRKLIEKIKDKFKKIESDDGKLSKYKEELRRVALKKYDFDNTISKRNSFLKKSLNNLKQEPSDNISSSKHFYHKIDEMNESLKESEENQETLIKEKFGVSSNELKDLIKIAKNVVEGTQSPNVSKKGVNSSGSLNISNAESEEEADKRNLEKVFPGFTDFNTDELSSKEETIEELPLGEEGNSNEIDNKELKVDKLKVGQLISSNLDDMNKQSSDLAKTLNSVGGAANSLVAGKQNLLEAKLEHLENKLKKDESKGSEGFESYKNPVILDQIHLASEPVGDRAQTGIFGLDPIIQGGLRRNTATLVAGGPGSGKTVFAMEYLINGLRNFDETGIFITFEQSRRALKGIFKQFGWDIDRLEKEKKLIVVTFTPEQLSKMLEAGGGSLRDMVDSIGAKRIAVDSMSDFMLLYKGDLSKRKACSDLFRLFAKFKCTALVISEQETDPLKHVSNVLEYQVDGVILLYNERVGDVRQRALEIFKMRGTKHAGRIFPMKITPKGVSVFIEGVAKK